MIYHFPDGAGQGDRLEEALLALKKEYQEPEMTKQQLETLKARMEGTNMGYKRKKTGNVKYIAAAALAGAFLALPNTSATAAHAMSQIPVIGQLVEAVTFRDYSYESDRNRADIQVPGLKPGVEADENLERTAEQINGEIEEITDRLVREFKENLEGQGGYQDVSVRSEVLTSTEDYFTLKLNCYQAAGSGYEWNYYYTIDLKTGERLKLSDLFLEGADYITPISGAIKEQMRKQMDEDENAIYWLGDGPEGWDFTSITEEASFYLDGDGQVVIGFDEGEVAPMYMGALEFKIPSDVLKNIRK